MNIVYWRFCGSFHHREMEDVIGCGKAVCCLRLLPTIAHFQLAVRVPQVCLLVHYKYLLYVARSPTLTRM